MAEQPHRRLMKCHVLFLGDSTPEETHHGLKALQQPLMKCYPVDSPSQVEGIDSWLTVFTSGILLQYVGSGSETPLPIWFPIQNLHLAAATKCINYIDPLTGHRMETEFLDINSAEAKDSSHPPLYSFIVRRTSGKRVLRCYTFLIRDEYPAEMLVDAAKYAFTHKSGWSNDPPLEEIIQAEIVPGTDDPDDVEPFDSVSAAGRKSNQPGDQSQSESEGSPTQNRSSFPANLVKKYTLTSSKRDRMGSTSPRRPIPREFMPREGFMSRGDGSMRSVHSGVGYPMLPPYMMAGNGNGSVRTTSSVRVVRDPRTRAPIVERLIREQVAVPVPVYQPPPPPQIIERVKPVYIPQPPEIREVPVELEVPVPVPVPYHVTEPEFYDQPPRGKSSRRYRSPKHDAFKNYQIFDDRITRADNASFVAHSSKPYRFSEQMHNYPVPPNGYFPPARDFYQPRTERSRKARGRRRSSSSDRSSDDSPQRPTREYDPNRRGGIEIVEVHSPDERKKTERKSERPTHYRHGKGYDIQELEKDTRNLGIREVNNNRAPGPEFKWSAMQVSSAKTKEEKKPGKDKKSVEIPYSPEKRGQMYVGADAIPNAKESRSSYHTFGSPTSPLVEELKQREKNNKRHDKMTKRIEEYPDYNGASTSKEYYFKEQTEGPPRNWMDQKKEHMNERAFSSSLANDLESNMTNAYALNRAPEDDTILDRQMPVPPLDIPIPPPLPPEMQTAAGLY
ncbi:uncharacterized protein [Watersipora subatra]